MASLAGSLSLHDCFFIFTATGNLELPVNLAACVWTVEGSRREPTQTGEHANSKQKDLTVESNSGPMPLVYSAYCWNRALNSVNKL